MKNVKHVKFCNSCGQIKDDLEIQSPGVTLRRLRQEVGFTQEKIADAAGIPRSNLALAETDKRKLGPKAFNRVIEALTELKTRKPNARVKEIRMQRGLTLAALAELIGTKDSGVAAIERATNPRPITLKTAHKLAAALDVDFRIFIEEAPAQVNKQKVNMTPGERLTELREAKNLTKLELAKAAKVSPASISLLENEKRPNAGREVAKKLGDFFGVDYREFL